LWLLQKKKKRERTKRKEEKEVVRKRLNKLLPVPNSVPISLPFDIQLWHSEV
jgi:hypothetical protein